MQISNISSSFERKYNLTDEANSYFHMSSAVRLRFRYETEI
jgi:hypothetical protein